MMNNDVGRYITEEEVRRIAEVEMTKAVMKNIDSVFIFNYVQSLETKLKKVEEYVRNIVDDDIYKAGWRYDVDGTRVRRDLEELLR